MSHDRTTLVLKVLTGDAGAAPEDYLCFHYINHRLLHAHNAELGAFLDALLPRCDGRCYDTCGERGEQRLDMLFEQLHWGALAGWASDQSWRKSTALPEGWPPVTRVITITALP